MMPKCHARQTKRRQALWRLSASLLCGLLVWQSHAQAEPPSVVEFGPRTVTIEPGTNVLIEVAVDHLNRIVTPFAAPTVRTVSAVSQEVEGNVVYVATAEEIPVTLYISDGSDNRTTIGLTLSPRRVPPREIRLQVPGLPATPAPSELERAGTSRYTGPTVGGAEQYSDSYSMELTTIFRALARNEVPAGYDLRRARGRERVTCTQSGLNTSPGQVLEGSHFRVVTARATARQPLEIVERACHVETGDTVAAVAAWPNVQLSSGESTEIYVAVRIDDSAETRDRPSLLIK